jgi:hypothetical protein
MIDWQKTNELFGILENTVTSKDKIVVICNSCKSIRNISYITYKNQIRLTGSDDCQSCKGKANRIKYSDSYKLSDENRSKSLSLTMKKKWENEQYKNEQINIFNSDINKEKLSNALKDKWKDENYKNKIISSIRYNWNDEEYKNKMKIIHDSKEFKVKSKPKLSKEQLLKLKNGVKEKWKDKDYKNIQSLSRIGKITSDKTKKKLHDIMLSKWQEHEYKTNVCIGREKIKGNESSIEIILYSILDDLGLKYIKQFRIGFYLFDCFLPDYNILIECNGDYWHSLNKAIKNDKTKSSYIINNFPQYKLYTIWEHEFKCKDKIIELIKYWTGVNIDLIDFEFNNLIIKDISLKDAKLFVDKYHYSGTIGNTVYRFGCYLGNELIALCNFGNTTRNESATRLNIKFCELLELTRFCIHPKYQKKNFASWFISRCINDIKHLNKYKCLISFADNTYNHDGIIYKASNWKIDGIVDPSYWYVDTNGYVMHKKTLWNHATQMKMSENEFANKYGYIKVIGKEKIRYIYWL